MSILQTAKDNYPFTEEVVVSYNDHLFDKGRGSIGDYTFDNEEQLASALFHLLTYFQQQSYDGRTLVENLGTGRTYTENIPNFVDLYIDPITNFIHDKLDETSNIIYLLEKYKKRTEWFMYNILLAKYNMVDNKQYEQVFEDDLRLYLFDQGIDYPFSTPKSASGRADIVGQIHTDDPLILEIKIFDTERGYRKNRVIDGFSQVVKYTNDYNKNVGYLVVFNVDNKEIEISTGESDRTFPPRIVLNNKVYYIVFVNLNFDVSASKTGALKVETITIEELLVAITP
ncbi:hypothetical protein [Chitinophaga silvisoli]|nr:hypothetical protein [Chitinophaga silvisoli]